MDPINGANEIDELLAETDTLYDFIELEEKWEENRQINDYPFRRFLHRFIDEDTID